MRTANRKVEADPCVGRVPLKPATGDAAGQMEGVLQNTIIMIAQIKDLERRSKQLLSDVLRFTQKSEE